MASCRSVGRGDRILAYLSSTLAVAVNIFPFLVNLNGLVVLSPRLATYLSLAVLLARTRTLNYDQDIQSGFFVKGIKWDTSIDLFC